MKQCRAVAPIWLKLPRVFCRSQTLPQNPVMKSFPLGRIGLAVGLTLLCHDAAFAQIGATLSGIGPINRSMGGAATAAPLDTLGAFAWNPATITALPNSTDFGLELLVPHSSLAS